MNDPRSTKHGRQVYIIVRNARIQPFEFASPEVLNDGIDQKRLEEHWIGGCKRCVRQTGNQERTHVKQCMTGTSMHLRRIPSANRGNSDNYPHWSIFTIETAKEAASEARQSERKMGQSEQRPEICRTQDEDMVRRYRYNPEKPKGQTSKLIHLKACVKTRIAREGHLVNEPNPAIRLLRPSHLDLGRRHWTKRPAVTSLWAPQISRSLQHLQLDPKHSSQAKAPIELHEHVVVPLIKQKRMGTGHRKSKV